MINKEDYKKCIDRLRRLSISKARLKLTDEKIAYILKISRQTMNNIDRWKEPRDDTKYKIVENYDRFMAYFISK